MGEYLIDPITGSRATYTISGDEVALDVNSNSNGGTNVTGSINILQNENYKQRIAYNSSNLAEYIGKAEAGVSIGSPNWQIQKLAYNSSMMVTEINYASGTSQFVNTWSGGGVYWGDYSYS